MQVLEKNNEAYLYSIINSAPGTYPIYVVRLARKSKGFMTVIRWNFTEAWKV